MIYIGTSGFVYKSWIGDFYPPDLPKSKYFQHYVNYFNSLELNSTFYRIPKATTMKNWKYKIKKLPDFKLSVKANRYITHTKKLKVDNKLFEFLDLVRVLGSNLGAVLFQLPPSLRFDSSLLKEFCESLYDDMEYAIEFRNDSWYCDETLNILSQKNIAFVWHDYEREFTKIKTADYDYVRLHGTEGRYKGSYSDEFLYWLANELGPNAYVYFNNTDDNSAFKDALRLRKIIAEKK